MGAPPIDLGHAALSRLTDLSREFAPELAFSIHPSFETIESEWRRFEQLAEGTPFQTYEWLATWHRHIGSREGVVPAIIVGQFADGKTAFIAPLAVEPRRSARRLCWLGQELCDYNAPLLARDFSQRVTPDRFLALWREVQARLQSDPELRYDWIEFEKMPQTVGVQSNPFINLGVIAQRQQRAYHAIGRRLGDVLPRQAIFGDAPAGPRQAQAHVGVRRDSLRHSRGAGRFAADARNSVGAEEADFCAQRHCRYFCAARIPGVLCRFRVESEFAASGPCQPR